MARPGMTVAGFTLIEEIDRGGFGEVWKAEVASRNQLVALKLVPLTNKAQAAAEELGSQLQRAFWQEHKMVPEVYVTGRDDHYFYNAMELITGPSLKELIANRTANVTNAARLTTAICRFLERTHSFKCTIDGKTYHSLVHADLKPAHILSRSILT